MVKLGTAAGNDLLRISSNPNRKGERLLAELLPADSTELGLRLLHEKANQTEQRRIFVVVVCRLCLGSRKTISTTVAGASSSGETTINSSSLPPSFKKKEYVRRFVADNISRFSSTEQKKPIRKKEDTQT